MLKLGPWTSTNYCKLWSPSPESHGRLKTHAHSGHTLGGVGNTGQQEGCCVPVQPTGPKSSRYFQRPPREERPLRPRQGLTHLITMWRKKRPCFLTELVRWENLGFLFNRTDKVKDDGKLHSWEAAAFFAHTTGICQWVSSTEAKKKNLFLASSQRAIFSLVARGRIPWHHRQCSVH
jgi:hypothetical protein